MRPTHLVSLVVLTLALAAVTGTAEDAAQILAAAKRASGGSAWDMIRSTHTRGKIEVGGLSGTFESWDDVATGRSLDRFTLGPTSGAQGFDGTVVWSQDAAGQVRREQGGEAQAGAANDAFRRSLAFWFPERWSAAVELLGAQEDGGRRYDVLRITPKGGRPYDLWIDSATLLFDRTVERIGAETRTVRFSEYRDVGGVKLPFASRSGNGEARYDQLAAVESVELNPPSTTLSSPSRHHLPLTSPSPRGGPPRRCRSSSSTTTSTSTSS